jgi:hypothetical protein
MSTIDPKLVDVILPEDSGYPVELQAQDTRDQLMMAAEEAGAVITAFPKHLWIEPKDWADAARDAKKYRTRAIDYIDRFTNQGGGNGGYSTHECTCHSLSRGFEAAWNRQRQIPVGPPVPNKRLEVSAASASVWVSPLSIYSEANPREWGGASVRQVLQIASKRGFLPDKIQPRDYGFKHTLHGTCGAGGVNQSRGPWVSLSKFPEGWQETAKHLRPLEYIFPESYEQSICLVIHGIVVCVGRDGHAVPHAEWLPEDNVMAYVDSYDVVRYDSVNRIRSTVGSSFGIYSTTVPDNYDKPAG